MLGVNSTFGSMPSHKWDNRTENCILHSSTSKSTIKSASGRLMHFVARFTILVLKLLWQQQEEEDCQTMENFSYFTVCGVVIYKDRRRPGILRAEEYKESPD